MAIDLTDAIFHDEDAARAHIEAVRWPNGPTCHQCGATDGITLLQGKSHRAGVYQCNHCRAHFTVTVGTVMERSHIPLAKWVLGFRLMAASKKGMSAKQLERMLDVTYKTAWFMAHRIREAMTDPAPAPLGGEGRIVEADEVYHGKRETPLPSPHRRGRPYIKRGKGNEKRTVLGLVERGGSARMMHVYERVTAERVAEFLVRNAERSSRLHTDESRLYVNMGKHFFSHETVNHGAKEYARGDVTTNSVEGFFGILKRGLNGVYQYCGEQHFQRYLNEFQFRYNYRIQVGYDDDKRTAIAIHGAMGKRLTYKGTHSP